MALGTHVVPVLLAPGPEQGVPREDPLLLVEVEPPPPSLLLGPRVPAEGESLDATARECHQVLLEGSHPEDEGDLEFLLLAVGSLGADHELAVTAEEP